MTSKSFYTETPGFGSWNNCYIRRGIFMCSVLVFRLMDYFSFVSICKYNNIYTDYGTAGAEQRGQVMYCSLVQLTFDNRMEYDYNIQLTFRNLKPRIEAALELSLLLHFGTAGRREHLF